MKKGRLYQSIPLILFFLLLLAPAGFAEEFIKEGEVLTIERCVAIALSRNPVMKAADQNVNISASRVGQARSAWLPQATLSSSISKFSSGSHSGGSGSELTASAALSQNIYDFGRTSSQVSLQKYNLSASREALQNTTEVLIFDVKQGYYRLLQAIRTREVAAEVVKQAEQHLTQANAFHEAGVKPRFDVIKAEVDLSTAKLGLITAQNAIAIAQTQLNTLMGVPNAPPFTLEDNFTFQKYEITFEPALARAMVNRPDLRSLDFQEKAAESALSFARKGNLPFLTGTASYDWAGDLTPLEDSWIVAASLTFPIFNGFLTHYQTSEARAGLELAKANKESLIQNVYLDVNQAYLGLVNAEQRTDTASQGVKQAQENLDLANGRYKYGVGSPVEVTDALIAYANANTSYINALYDYKVAVADLERAMGMGGGTGK